MRNLIAVLFVFIVVTCTAQKQTNIWYFGNNAGLDFNSGSPVVLTNSAMSQAEGVSSISDQNGSLLFYTDGISVWNANHVTMPNGTGLGGSGSTTQSALIVQQPGSLSLYYLFTLDAQLGTNGFKYSIVDMSLAGGLGDVTTKNVLMYTPATEKITAINHSNGFDVWIITHDYNNADFQAYPLTAAGFNTTPVVSTVGPPVSVGDDVIGYLKVSPDGNHLAMALCTSNEFWLFNFDPSTGLVTNPVLLNSAPVMGGGAYGVEFSPNSNILYGTIESTPSDLYQWDLSSGNAATINASRISLPHTLINAAYMGSLSNAPDGKIYFTRNTCSYLGVINNPDVLGLGCNVTDSAIYLLGNSCVYGLPNLNQSFYNSGFTTLYRCFGDSTQFNIPTATGMFGAQWDFGDPASGPNNTSFLNNPVHYFSAPGTYNVTVYKFYASYTDTVTKPVEINAIPVINLGPDSSFCTGTPFVINAGSGYGSYIWQDNSTDSLFTTTLPGTFWVTVSNNGCSATDSIVLGSAPCNFPVVNLSSSDTTFCDKQCLDFTDLSTNSPTSWQWFFPGADSTSSTLQNPTGICYNAYGTFDVTLIACNAVGCDTLYLPGFITEFQIPAPPVITQSTDTLYSTPAFTYSWYNTLNPGTVISTSSFYVTNTGGSYFVIVRDSNGCQNISTVFTATGIEETTGNASVFTVSPNPAGSVITINVSNSYMGTVTEAGIINLVGQEVRKLNLTGQQTVISLENISNGIYFINLKTSKGIFNKKLMVNH